MENVILRPIKLSDVDTMVELTNNSEVTRYIPDIINDRAILESWIRDLKPNSYEFIVELSKKTLGECSLEIRDDTGEIGIMLFQEYWRMGYGTQIVERLIKEADEKGLRMVTAETAQKNTACIGLLEKLGFHRTGINWKITENDFEKDLDVLFTTISYEKEIVK